MALELNISACIKNSCNQLQVEDITGVYDAAANSGGWEDASTLLGSNVSTAEIIITFPDGTTQTETVTSQFPGTVTGTITYDLISVSDSSSFSDGLYNIKYKITSTTNEVYTAQLNPYFTCNAECSVGKLWSAYASAFCTSSCDVQLKLEKAQLGEGLLSAIKASVLCNNTTTADNLLERLTRLADYEDCGC
jgi:hypothetical protein